MLFLKLIILASNNNNNNRLKHIHSLLKRLYAYVCCQAHVSLEKFNQKRQPCVLSVINHISSWPLVMDNR